MPTPGRNAFFSLRGGATLQFRLSLSCAQATPICHSHNQIKRGVGGGGVCVARMYRLTHGNHGNKRVPFLKRGDLDQPITNFYCMLLLFNFHLKYVILRLGFPLNVLYVTMTRSILK